jgi:hypothetical protein
VEVTKASGVFWLPVLKRSSFHPEQDWLVVTGTFGLFFHILGIVIIPTDEDIFFRGVGQPPTKKSSRSGSLVDEAPMGNSWSQVPLKPCVLKKQPQRSRTHIYGLLMFVDDFLMKEAFPTRPMFDCQSTFRHFIMFVPCGVYWVKSYLLCYHPTKASLFILMFDLCPIFCHG